MQNKNHPQPAPGYETESPKNAYPRFPGFPQWYPCAAAAILFRCS